MKINGTDINKFGARLLEMNVGGTSITRQSANTFLSCLPPQAMTIGTKKLSVTLVYSPKFLGGLEYSPSRKALINAVSVQKSGLESLFLNTQEPLKLEMPDGFIYFAYITNIGDTKYGNELETEYTFEAVKCRGLVTHTFEDVEAGTSVEFISKTQVPTYCIYEFSPSNSNINTITFDSIGTVKGFSGVNTVRIDGRKKEVFAISNQGVVVSAPSIVKASSFVSFPTVNPGANVIYISNPVPVYETVFDSLKIQYYPVFV